MLEQLSSAWARWVENTIERKRMVMKSTKVIMRWKNTCAVCCLGAWHEHAQEEARRRDILRRTVLRIKVLYVDAKECYRWEHSPRLPQLPPCLFNVKHV